jgi:cathepsin H
MKAAFSLLALAVAVTSTAAADSRSPSHALVFQVPLAADADCHALKAEASCLAAHCAWCKAGAVPSACYTSEEAQQLPPAVFQCDTKPSAQSWALTEVPEDAAGMRALFNAWRRARGKNYATALEAELRADVFSANARLVATHNARDDVSFTMELNDFADLSWDEFQRWYLGSPQNCSATSRKPNTLTYSAVPDAKDWREDGAVSPVKNQGQCGSCWAFSSTGCLESHVKLTHGTMVLLSEQNLLDCADAFDTHGCNGGLPSHAFEYVHFNGGIDTEASYPYDAVAGKCKFNAYHVGAQVESVVNITARDETELKGAVGSVGPVSVAFQVVSDFRFYKSGVYASSECKDGEQDVNHAVLAVGYGVEDGTKHWIVKNSWGDAWGQRGFFQIARDENMCGIADCAAYPVVA